MTTILTAAVVVLALLVVLDLALTLAIIRRLRVIGTGAAAHKGNDRTVDVFASPAIGSAIPLVQVQAESGAPVDTATFTEGGALLAFAAVGCKPCHDQIPELREVVEARVSRGERALVVVLAPDPASEPADDFVAAFEGLAPVVVETGPRLGQAFEIEGYPTYLEFADGRVEHVAALVRDLSVRV